MPLTQKSFLPLLLGLGFAACQPAPEIPAEEDDARLTPIFPEEEVEEAVSAEDSLPPQILARLREVERPPRPTRWDDVPIEELARPPRGEESVCEKLARRTAEFALRHPEDAQAFLRALQDEVVAGTDDPFELERGLQEGRWNQEYIYAGHGGFRPEYDDAQRYPRGGNHQPGHFVSVLSIAARFGETPALIAIARAGDYDPGDEDDLRLSLEAIQMGVGLRDETLMPADVARRVRGLCR